MIYIHRFKMAFGHKKIDHVKVYESQEFAMEQQRLLGGSLQAYVSVEEIAERADIAASEISEKFDDIASRQLHLEAPLMWHKAELIVNTKRIIRGEFDKETGQWKTN